MSIVFVVVAVIAALLWAYSLANQNVSIDVCTILFVVAAGCGITSCATSGWKAESDKRAEAQAAADMQPRVIREVDGCKVYAFKSGDRWHYFTRCADQTTTESSYDVRSGKTTRTEVESITTKNGAGQ